MLKADLLAGQTPALEVFLLGIVVALSFIGTGAVRRYALAYRLVEGPGPRHSHAAPTPHGGGLAIASVFLCALLFLIGTGTAPFAPCMALLGGGFIVAAIGFWDDHKPAPAQLRLLVHFAAAAWALYWLGGAPPLPVGDRVLNLGALGYVVGAVVIVWLLNLYNFMDGIDGLAAVEAISVAGAACLLMTGEADASLLTSGLILAATAGFLPWNWPPARIFMGDVGSGFLGFTLAVVAFQTAQAGDLTVWVWAILLGVFIVDATVTLIIRMVRGLRWYEAHRTHAYQHAAAAFGSHRRVTLAVLIINVLWLFPLAWFVNTHREWGLVGTIAAWLPLLVLAMRFKAGRADADSRALP
jgi:Fuc2NAc and GlcNAc transferase